MRVSEDKCIDCCLKINSKASAIAGGAMDCIKRIARGLIRVFDQFSVEKAKHQTARTEFYGGASLDTHEPIGDSAPEESEQLTLDGFDFCILLRAIVRNNDRKTQIFFCSAMYLAQVLRAP